MARKLAILLGIGVLCSSPQLVSAGEYQQKLSRSFHQFCSVWMAKLDEREQRNQKIAKPAANDRGVIVEYTAYTDSPVSCEVKPVGSSGALVGRIVYHELLVQKHGATEAQAQQGEENVVERIEVLEIFRFDGKAWKY